MNEETEVQRLIQHMDDEWPEDWDANAIRAELLRLQSLKAELLEIAKSVEGMVSNCDVNSGVCCCGDSMDKHPDPMYCGHSPVDSGIYAAESLLKKTRAAIAKAQGEMK